jgi:hypothetical protein
MREEDLGARAVSASQDELQLSIPLIRRRRRDDGDRRGRRIRSHWRRSRSHRAAPACPRGQRACPRSATPEGSNSSFRVESGKPKPKLPGHAK